MRISSVATLSPKQKEQLLKANKGEEEIRSYYLPPPTTAPKILTWDDCLPTFKQKFSTFKQDFVSRLEKKKQGNKVLTGAGMHGTN
jgi:hypothetical protein